MGAESSQIGTRGRHWASQTTASHNTHRAKIQGAGNLKSESKSATGVLWPHLYETTYVSGSQGPQQMSQERPVFPRKTQTSLSVVLSVIK